MLDDTKKEMDHLRKQIRSLGTALVLTQVTMITCTPDDFRIDMEIDTTVRFVSYSGKGKLREQGEYESKIPLVQSHRLP